MHRRDALRVLSAAVALPVLRGLTPSELDALGRRAHEFARSEAAPALGAFTAHEDRTVAAACERIIPATDTPGAAAARVNRFIDAMLSNWYPPADRDRFVRGLAELDRRSRRAYTADFVSCEPAEQTALLVALDDEVAALRRAAAISRSPSGPGAASPDEHWFAMLKFLTIWGYYTSEVAQTRELRLFPLTGRYDGCAPYPREQS